MRRQPSACGDDRLGGQHPGQIPGRRLVGDQNHRVAALAPLDCAIAAERNAADRRSSRGRQPSAELDFATGELQLRMKQRLEVGVADAAHRGDVVDHPGLEQIDSQPDRDARRGPIKLARGQ